MAHLWEVEHSYSCEDGNFFKVGQHVHYKSWKQFIEGQIDADLDLSLLFRFDFEPPWEDGINTLIVWQGDENYRDCKLKLYFMDQRKAKNRSVSIEVCRSDETEIKEWLKVRWIHMKKLWSPISGD